MCDELSRMNMEIIITSDYIWFGFGISRWDEAIDQLSGITIVPKVSPNRIDAENSQPLKQPDDASYCGAIYGIVKLYHKDKPEESLEYNNYGYDMIMLSCHSSGNLRFTCRN